VIVRPARWPDDADAVRALLREYAQDPNHAEGLCFQRFDEELAGLPGPYDEPAGCFLVAEDGGELVACVALRPVGTTGDGELKRLFVRPHARRYGLGRTLSRRIVTEAKRRGYHRLCLDTLPHMTDAIRLYRGMGFTEIPPYLPSPTPDAICLAYDLDQIPTPPG
jgi:ribosomal protein S18 acetylase RimI-like enzyme